MMPFSGCSPRSRSSMWRSSLMSSSRCRLGRAVLQKLGTLPVVVIDPDASLQRECEEAGHLFLLGSALEEGSLRAAGIERAWALTAATLSDPDNVFISLFARELCPQIGGADQVISPHRIARQPEAARGGCPAGMIGERCRARRVSERCRARRGSGGGWPARRCGRCG